MSWFRLAITRFLTAAALVFGTSVICDAQTRVWSGGGAPDPSWTNPANWGGTAPNPLDELTFATATFTTSNNNTPAGTQYTSIVIDVSAPTYNLTGNAITAGGDIADSSPNPQTITFPLILSDNRVVNVFDPGGSLSLNGVISSPGGAFGIRKIGPGRLTLRANDTYAGATVIEGGTLAYATDNTGVQLLAFGITPTATEASTVTSTLDLTNANVTATGLTVQTNNTTADVITIGAGKTLTVNGPFTVGISETYTNPNPGTTTALNVTGNSLVINGAASQFMSSVARSNAATGADPITSLDMSGLANFSYAGTTGEFRIGAGNARSTVLLANTANTVTAAQVRIGDSAVGNSGNNNGGRSILRLGGGSNVINTGALIIGETKSGGTMEFQGASGTLTIAGQAGGASTANIQVGSSSNATGSGDESMLLLAGHSVTVQGGNVVIGRLAGSATGGNSGRGNVTFDMGTFNANSLHLGVNSNGTAPNGATGVFTLGGPTPGAGATGVLNVASQFYLANRTNTNAAAGRSSGTFVINGGTANIATDILDASTTLATAGANVTTLTLDGGILNMMGHNIGSYAAPITNVNLNSGTLNNPGVIAGNTITLMPAVTITGAPNYILADGGTMTSALPALTLAGGGGLGGGGAVPGTVSGDVAAAAGSRIAPGSNTAAGTLQFNNNLSLNNGSTVRFKLSDNAFSGNDNINVPFGSLNLAGTINLEIGALGAGPQVGNTYTLFNYATLTGNQTNFAVTGFGSRATFTVVPTAGTPGSIQLAVGGSAPLPLTWVGNVNNNWDLNGTSNWRDAGLAPQKFFNQDIVTFNDTSTNTNDVQLVGQLAPGSVTVSATRNYKFAGSGGVTGGGSLTKDMSGTLVLATDNSYTGTTDIIAGTLQIGDGGATGSLGAGVVNNAGTLDFRRNNALNVANVINGSGNVLQNGAGTLTLSGNSTFSGGVTLNNGAVRLTSATGAGAGGSINVFGLGRLIAGAPVANPITLAGGTFGTSVSPLTFTGDVTAAGATTSTIRLADPQNLPTAAIDVNEIIFTGNLMGNGNLNILSNGQDNNPDGGNGFRLRGTTLTTYSGTITVGNNIKFELQSASPTPFSPAGSGKIVMTAGDAALATSLTTLTTTAGYSEINIRNNSTGDTTFGNDIAITGSGLVIFNPLGTAPAGSKATMGNLSIGSGQEAAVYLAAAPAHVLEFPTVTLNGTATFSPKKPGFGADASVGSDLALGNITETVASGLVMNGLATLLINGTANYTGTTTINSGVLRVTGAINSNNAVTVAAPATFAVEGTASSVGAINGAGITTVGNGVSPTSLSASSVRQSSLTIAADSQVTTRAGGATSVLAALSIAGTPDAPTAKLDLTNSALVLDYPVAGPNPAADTRQQIIVGRGGTGLGKPWNGKGITSSTAQADVAASPNSRSIGYAVNADLPLGALTTFRGQAVDPSSVLIRYTRTADANLDGVVNDDDVTVVGTFYAPGVSKPEWAKGDFDYNGFVNDDDVTLLGVFYNPAATPIPSPSAESPAVNITSVPEPTTPALAFTATLIIVGTRWRRRDSAPRLNTRRTGDLQPRHRRVKIPT